MPGVRRFLRTGTLGILLAGGLLGIPQWVQADEAEEPEPKTREKQIEDLAVGVQNPVSDLEILGFSQSIAFGTPPTNATLYNLNLQGNTTRQFGQWSLLNRLAIPLFYLPSNFPDFPMGDSGRKFGLGDIEYTGFLVRDESKRFFKTIGGLGPTLIFNSATDERMGLGKWLIGPTLAIIRLPYPWVHGIVARNLWSFAGDSDRENVNLLLLRPFLNYNFSTGWYLTSTPSIFANWKADSRNRWTVPVGGGVGKVVFRGEKHPIDIRFQGFYLLEKPDIAPDWTLLLNFRVLFPETLY